MLKMQKNIWRNNNPTLKVKTKLRKAIILFRDVNEARSGRGRGQQHEAEAEANSHEAEAEAKIAFFSAKFYILNPFSQKNFWVDFRQTFA